MSIHSPLGLRTARLVQALVGVLLTAAGCGNDTTAPGSPETETVVTDETTTITLAAQRDAPAFLEKIPTSRLAAYGFASRSELKEVVVEQPIQVYLDTTDAKGDRTEGFRPTSEWRVPLSVDGKWRVLLTIAKQGDAYAAVALGGTPLAGSLQDTVRALPKDATNRHLLRIRKTRQDWLGYETAARTEPHFLRLMQHRPTEAVVNRPVSRATLMKQLVGMETPR